MWTECPRRDHEEEAQAIPAARVGREGGARLPTRVREPPDRFSPGGRGTGHQGGGRGRGLAGRGGRFMESRSGGVPFNAEPDQSKLLGLAVESEHLLVRSCTEDVGPMPASAMS